MSQIRAYRMANGLTQADLGKKVGLSQAQIARLESGQSELTIKQVRDFATALRYEPWQLLPKDFLPTSFYRDIALQIDYGTSIYNEALELYKQNKKVMDLILQQAKVTNRLLEKYNQLRERENVKEAQN